MTTLVTGASGFLGSHVTRQLVTRGEDVRVLLRPSSTNRAIADLSLEYVTGDLRDPASVARAMQGAKRVFHVAADYRFWARRKQEIYDSNVGGTKNVLDAARRAGSVFRGGAGDERARGVIRRRSGTDLDPADATAIAGVKILAPPYSCLMSSCTTSHGRAFSASATCST